MRTFRLRTELSASSLNNYFIFVDFHKQRILSVCLFVCLFVWAEALRPSQQFFSHVGTEPPLLGYYQCVFGR